MCIRKFTSSAKRPVARLCMNTNSHNRCICNPTNSTSALLHLLSKQKQTSANMFFHPFASSSLQICVWACPFLCMHVHINISQKKPTTKKGRSGSHRELHAFWYTMPNSWISQILICLFSTAYPRPPFRCYICLPLLFIWLICFPWSHQQSLLNKLSSPLSIQ